MQDGVTRDSCDEQDGRHLRKAALDLCGYQRNLSVIAVQIQDHGVHMCRIANWMASNPSSAFITHLVEFPSAHNQSFAIGAEMNNGSSLFPIF